MAMSLSDLSKIDSINENNYRLIYLFVRKSNCCRNDFSLVVNEELPTGWRIYIHSFFSLSFIMATAAVVFQTIPFISTEPLSSYFACMFYFKIAGLFFASRLLEL